MTDKRYYYDDQIAALYMERNYGMLYESDGAIRLHNPTLCTMIAFPDTATRRIYIHPDSYGILKPILGDTIMWELNNHYQELSNHYREKHCKTLRSDKDAMDYIEAVFNQTPGMVAWSKIVQRNDLPFHWPKEEVI